MTEGYKNTPIGTIPSDWTVRSLDELAEIRTGIAKNSGATVSNPVLVHYLRVANVQDGFLDLSEMSQLRVSREDVRHYAVLAGDMLMIPCETGNSLMPSSASRSADRNASVPG